MKKTKKEKSLFQITSSVFVMIVGIFVMLSVIGNITGNAIGNSGNVNYANFIIVLWGLVVLGIGVWMIRKGDFHDSVFGKK